jgi:mandelamide amidase
MSSSTNKIERRNFLIGLSLFASSAAISGLLPGRAISAGANMSELTASAAIEAMRNGDIKAEDYARALLDRAQELAHLNAFRTLNREMVLEAARAADKARGSGDCVRPLVDIPM